MGLITPLSQFLKPQIARLRYPSFVDPFPSSLNVVGLVATPGLGQVVLTWIAAGDSSAVEVWAAKSNNRSSANHFGDGTLTGFTHVVVPQSGPWYYWVRARDNAGNYGDWFPSDPLAGVSSTHDSIPNTQGLNFNLINGTILATVAANRLSVSVKTKSGNDPSPLDPVLIAFPSPSGTYDLVAITYPVGWLSMGALFFGSFGAVNGVPFNLWVMLANDGGIVRMAIGNCSATTGFLSIEDGGLITTTRESVAPGTTSALVLYSELQITARSSRIVARLTWANGLAAVGLWSVAPTVQLFAQGTKKPGEIVRQVYNFSAASSGFAGTIPYDDTIPQIGEGNQLLTTDFTPSAKANILAHDALFNFSGAAVETVILALFQDSGVNALAVGYGTVLAADRPTEIGLSHRMVANTTAPTTFSVRGGTVSGATSIQINGKQSIGRAFGGAMKSGHGVTEYQG